MPKPAKPKTHKLDIFQTLTSISRKNQEYYSNLSEEEKKGFMPLVVERWLTGTRDARQVYFINELVNPFVFSLANHKPLLYKLMTICTSGKSGRYNWTKALSKKSSSTPIAISCIKQYYDYSTLHAIDALPLLSNDDILLIAEDLGKQKEDIAKLKRELKKRT